MRFLLTFAVFTLAACQQAEPPKAPVEEVVQPDPVGEPLTGIGDLLGEYRVAGIDGEPLSGNAGIAVSIDGPLLSYDPTCAGFVWQLEFEGESLSTQRYSPYPPPAAGEPPRHPCAVRVPPEWSKLGVAVDAATAAYRTPENAIVLSGGDHSVTLFSQ